MMAMAVEPEATKATAGVNDARGAINTGHDEPIGEVEVGSVAHLPVATTQPNDANEVPKCTAARTCITSRAKPSENGVPALLNDIETLVTIVRSRFAGVTGCGSDTRVRTRDQYFSHHRPDPRDVQCGQGGKRPRRIRL